MIHHGCLDGGVLLLSKPYRKSQLACMVRMALAVVVEARLAATGWHHRGDGTRRVSKTPYVAGTHRRNAKFAARLCSALELTLFCRVSPRYAPLRAEKQRGSVQSPLGDSPASHGPVEQGKNHFRSSPHAASVRG
jgi:hypothetical protein